MKKQYRQGDVWLELIDSLPAGLKKYDGDIILAYGEVTGHAHRIKTGADMWLAENGQKYLQITEATQLLHEEHSAIQLTEGLYKITQQKEYSPAEIRNVAD